jgi:hypothetical protein
MHPRTVSPQVRFWITKAENSALVQVRTGRIGLAKFLFNHKVTGMESAKCRCGAGEETPRHRALHSTEEIEYHQYLRVNEESTISN